VEVQQSNPTAKPEVFVPKYRSDADHRLCVKKFGKQNKCVFDVIGGA
jgi:hypothetical protein